jgi:hypothetical protein
MADRLGRPGGDGPGVPYSSDRLTVVWRGSILKHVLNNELDPELRQGGTSEMLDGLVKYPAWASRPTRRRRLFAGHFQGAITCAL